MKRAGVKDRKVIGRIAALLFALAALAVRAGVSPLPVRVAVLWLLRAAEPLAREFVVAAAREAGVEPGLPAHARHADDAGRLAQSFTALAEVLASLASLGPQPQAGASISDHTTLARGPWCPAPAPSTLERPLSDTS
jgi:hypothetical protein